MNAIANKAIKVTSAPIEVTRTKQRSTETRSHNRKSMLSWQTHEPIPAAGAHALSHLINEDATPGAGVLASHPRYGREVDGGAG